MIFHFCICYSDINCANAAVACINDLNVPEGVEIQISTATEAENVAEAYNALTENFPADYNVFLQENVYIVNHEFISDVISVFSKDDSIHLVGIMGESSYKSADDFGKWDVGSIHITDDRPVDTIKCDFPELYKTVDSLNGMLIVTDYLPKWDSMSDDKNGYFDIDQSLKAREMGYKLAVAGQKEPWCILNIGKSLYERNDFYASDIVCTYIHPENNENNPLVSVIIPVYCSEDLLADTLDSVINQTYKNLQIIVVDDASSDRSPQIIEEYARKDSRIVPILLDKNVHVCEASNIAFNMCKGMYVALIGHDDLWDPEKLSKQLVFMKTHKEYGACMTSIKLIDEYRRDISKHSDATESVFAFENGSRKQGFERFFYKGNAFCAPSALVRRDVIGEKLYNPALVQTQDCELWMRILLKYNIYVMKEHLTEYRYHIYGTQNLSGDSPEKQNRYCHEAEYLSEHFLKTMDNETFTYIFEDKLIKKGKLSDAEIMCEKAFILKDKHHHNFPAWFMDIFDNPDTYNVLVNEYNYSAKDFYAINEKPLICDDYLMDILNGKIKINGGTDELTSQRKSDRKRDTEFHRGLT